MMNSTINRLQRLIIKSKRDFVVIIYNETKQKSQKFKQKLIKTN